MSISTEEARTEGNMGNFYLNEGQEDLALEHYQRAIWISPTNAQPYAGIAQINLRRGDTGRAYEYIRKALRLIPTQLNIASSTPLYC